MNVKLNKVSSNKVEIEIEIPIPQVGVYFDLAASEISKNMKVSGFRPGKVPADIVEREAGSQKLYDQAANLAIQKTLPKAILDEEIEIVGQPDIVVTQIARGNPMKYKATFWTMPEVELGEYKGLKIKKKEVKVEDKDINKSLEYLQKSRAKVVTVNRPAKKGDQVEVDFNENKNYPLILGEGHFDPNFEKEIEGMKVNEEKKISLTDKKLDFKVKLKLVQERDIPKLSDEFAKSLGEFKSLEDLKKSVKQGLTQEKEAREKERMRIELVEKVVQDSKMDIHDALIDIELDKMINELQQSTLSMGLEFDKYLQQIKKTVEELKKEWREQAEKRVGVGLVLKAIAEKEKIEANEKDVEEKVNEQLKHYPNIENAKKNIDVSALKEYTRGIMRNEKVFELLEREAKII